MADNDWLGGYTLEELLGSKPVTKTKKQTKKHKKQTKKQARVESGKRGFLSATLGAPFRLIGGILKLPFTVVGRLAGGVGKAAGEVVKLPVRVLGAIASPWRKK